MAFKATARVFFAESGCLETYGSGNAATRAAALDELAAVLAIVPGTAVRSFSITETLDPATAPALHADSKSNDLTLVLQKPGTIVGTFKTPSRRIQKASVEYHPVNTPEGFVDITNADLLAIATAYRDNEGEGGYILTSDSSYSCG